MEVKKVSQRYESSFMEGARRDVTLIYSLPENWWEERAEYLNEQRRQLAQGKKVLVVGSDGEYQKEIIASLEECGFNVMVVERIEGEIEDVDIVVGCKFYKLGAQIKLKDQSGEKPCFYTWEEVRCRECGRVKGHRRVPFAQVLVAILNFLDEQEVGESAAEQVYRKHHHGRSVDEVLAQRARQGQQK